MGVGTMQFDVVELLDDVGKPLDGRGLVVGRCKQITCRCKTGKYKA